MPPKGQRATNVPLFHLWSIEELVNRSQGYYKASTLMDYRAHPGIPFRGRFKKYWRNLLRDDPRLQGKDVFGEDEDALSQEQLRDVDKGTRLRQEAIAALDRGLSKRQDLFGENEEENL